MPFLLTFEPSGMVEWRVLPTQGCTTSKHNPVKPPEPEKPKEKPLAIGEVNKGLFSCCYYGADEVA